VQPRELTFLSGAEVERLALSDDEILAAVEEGLRAQGSGSARIEPRVHLEPDPAVRGHFNVLRGYLAPLQLAGVKVVGDYLDNHELGLPSELGLLALFDARTGAPVAVIEASALTAMRTGALTAIGARYLAKRDSRILGHVGARGTAYWNVRLLDRLFDFAEIRVHSLRRESRESFARLLEADLGKPVRVTESWEDCLRGADIMVEASRLERPEPRLETRWVEPGCLVIPYGTISAVELTLLRKPFPGRHLIVNLLVDGLSVVSGLAVTTDLSLLPTYLPASTNPFRVLLPTAVDSTGADSMMQGVIRDGGSAGWLRYGVLP